MINLKRILKEHRIVIIIAFIVAILSIAPQIVFINDDAFRGVQMFGADAEEHYVARMQEAYEGNADLGNVFLPNKDQPYLTPGLGEATMAYISKSLFTDIIQVNVFSKFVIPLFLFLLLYAFVYKVFRSKTIAILSASLTFLGYNLLSSPNDILGLFTATTSLNGFLTYTRPINPGISSLLLFSSLYLLFDVAKIVPKYFYKAILLGVLSGISLYITIYTWSFLFVFIGLYFLYYLYQKDRVVAKNLLSILIINLLTTIPFWINFIALRRNEFFLDTSIRQGLIENSSFVISMWLIVGLLLIIFLWPKIYHRSKTFFLFAILSLWIVTNQHIVTGMFIQPSHYHWYITKPIISIMLVALLVYVLKKYLQNKFLLKIVFTAGVLLLLYNATLIQVNSYQVRYQSSIEKQAYAPVISYLDTSFKEPIVIWGNEMSSELIPMYTIHDAPNNGYAGLYLSGEDYFIKRLFLNYKLRGINPENVYDVMMKERARVSSRVYLIYYREKYGSYDAIPDSVIRSLANGYEDFYKLDYGEIFRYFKIDVVVWDKAKDIGFSDEAILSLDMIDNIDDRFVIYEVR